jgi:GT2 family glycosyltransferase
MPASSSRASPRVLFAPRDPPPLRPDAATDLPRYRAWVDERRRGRLAAAARTPVASRPGPAEAGPGPAITFLLPVEEDDPRQLRRCLGALRAQTDGAWRLRVALIGERRWRVGRPRRPGGGSRGETRTSVARFPSGTAVPDALGALLGHTVTPAVALLSARDELEADAVALLRAALGDADLAYGDEDEIDGAGRLVAPKLKPAWSPDLLLSTSYLGRPVAVRVDALRVVGGICDLPGGDWEHDLVLRVTEGGARVAHVAEVLCHRRAQTPGSGAGRTGTDRGPGDAAVVNALARRGEPCIVAPGLTPGAYRLLRHPPRRTSVSVIIPLRDQPGYLRACVDSLGATAPGDAVDFELVLVDNGSADPETLTLLERLAQRQDVTVLRDPRPFNWASLNNAAAARSGGEVLLFLNNDIEAVRSGWVELLAAQALRSDVAAVGARLVYPDGRVQHVGVVVGLGGAAGHVLAGLSGTDPGYLGMAVLARDCTAVTGACLATRRAVFDEVGGFDEELGLDLNDIDYCLRAAQLGYRVVMEPAAELVHHESPSRGTSGSIPDITRFVDRWENVIRAGDRFLSPNLTRVDSSCALRGPDEESWWQQWRSILSRS